MPSSAAWGLPWGTPWLCVWVRGGSQKWGVACRDGGRQASHAVQECTGGGRGARKDGRAFPPTLPHWRQEEYHVEKGGTRAGAAAQRRSSPAGGKGSSTARVGSSSGSSGAGAAMAAAAGGCAAHPA
jgi:hypothetical protein